MNIAMQIKLNKISQIPAEIFKKLCKDHRFEPTFWDIFKYLLMRCAHFSMLLMRMKPINFIFSKSMYIVSEYQSTSRHQFEQYFNFVQQLTLPVVETRGFTTVSVSRGKSDWGAGFPLFAFVVTDMNTWYNSTSCKT